MDWSNGDIVLVNWKKLIERKKKKWIDNKVDNKIKLIFNKPNKSSEMKSGNWEFENLRN